MGGKGSGALAKYPQEQIDYALAIVAIHAGRTQRAADALAAEGKPVPQGTLDYWKHHPDGRYDRVSKIVQDKIADKIATDAETTVLLAAELEREGLELLRGKMREMKAAELAGAVRNITTTKALNADKIIGPLRGRATQILEIRDANQIIASLQRKLPPRQLGEIEAIPDEAA